MDAGEMVGFAAGALTTLANVPQAVKAWRTRSTEDLSLKWLILLLAGLILWLVSGILHGSVSLMVANGVTALIVASILVAKLRNG